MKNFSQLLKKEPEILKIVSEENDASLEKEFEVVIKLIRRRLSKRSNSNVTAKINEEDSDH